LTITPTASRRVPALLPAALLAALALLAGACSSSNKNNKTASATVAPTSAAATRTPSAAATTAPPTATAAAPTRTGGTPAAGASPVAGGTPAPLPNLTEVAKNLLPLLFQTAQLPGGERDFQSGPPQPVGNDDLVRGRPDAKSLQDKYDAAGRLGGVAGGWAKPGGQVTPQTKSLYLITCVLSQYRDADGAQQGYTLGVQQVQSTPQQQGATQTTTAEAQAAQVGSAATAFRQDQATVSTLNGQPFTTHIITYTQVWQRGPIVAQCSFGGINEDPPLSDFQQIIRTQDADLQQGGF
jgi:hypothetical protein